jgi:hypothetical protein
MDQLLALLQASVAEMRADCEAIKRDYAAMNAMAGDIVNSIERREAAHREFSMFTNEEGRA